MKKLISLLICLSMMLGILGGCGGSAEEAVATPAAEEEADIEDLYAEMEAMLAEYRAELAEKLDAYESDTTVFTVYGESVDWDLYAYSLLGGLYSYAAQTGEKPDTATPVDGEMTMGDYFTDMAVTYAKYYAILRAKAAEHGVSWEEEDEAELQSILEEVLSQAGSQEALEEELRGGFLTLNAYRTLVQSSLLGIKLQEKLYGEGGSAITDEQAQTWARENNIVRAKHILLETVNDAGEALSDGEKSALYERMEGYLARLEPLRGDAAALEAEFDVLMAESEDPGSAFYTDGYYFTTGEMVAEFEEAAFALEENGLSGIVESPYGYHILLRLPIEPDNVVGVDNSSYQPVRLREQLADDFFNALAEEWLEEEVLWDSAFEDFSLAQFMAG